MIDRLDEEKLDVLRRWGAGLALARREELRAAGQAITVLIEEIDRLQIDLWNSRADDRVEPAPSPAIAEALGERLSARIAAASDSAASTGSTV